MLRWFLKASLLNSLKPSSAISILSRLSFDALGPRSREVEFERLDFRIWRQIWRALSCSGTTRTVGEGGMEDPDDPASDVGIVNDVGVDAVLADTPVVEDPGAVDRAVAVMKSDCRSVSGWRNADGQYAVHS